jgi:hypothetical protein
MSIPVDRFLLFSGILVVALVLLTIGIIVTLRSRSSKRSTLNSPVEPKPAPAGKAVTRSEGPTRVPANAIVVLRDPASNEWLVEVNGMRYNALKDIHDDQAASKVLEALEGLQRFAGTIPIITPQPSTTLPTKASIAPRESIPYVPPDTAARIEPPVAEALSKASQGSQPRHPAPPNSILDQIEKLLQRNLLKEADLVHRRIHIGAAADGSLLIEVDWDMYKSADEVPDPLVRNVIKSSIQEWERTA